MSFLCRLDAPTGERGHILSQIDLYSNPGSISYLQDDLGQVTKL